MLTKRYLKSRKVSKVSFELPKAEWPEDVKVESAYLVGEFNDWEPTATPMKRGKGGAFRTTVELEPGREYQFRYLANGVRWCGDWHADAYAPGGLDKDNFVVIAPAAGS